MAPPSAPGELPDWYLLKRIQDGDRAAAGELHARYADRLRTVAARNTAISSDPDDIVQSAFRTFLTAADNGHYHVPDGRDLWSLLVTIVLNKLRSHARHAMALKRTPAGLCEPLADTPAPWGDDPALIAAARDILAGLPELEREMVELRMAGHSIEEIAARLGRSHRTVERNLQACRGRLNEQVLRHA